MRKPKYYRISYNTYNKEEGIILHKKKVHTKGLELYLKHFKQGHINELLIENWIEGMNADNLHYKKIEEKKIYNNYKKYLENKIHAEPFSFEEYKDLKGFKNKHQTK